MAKPLTEAARKALVDKLIAEDVRFADQLQQLQKDHFPNRLRGIGEWAKAEEIKRLILGVADKQIIEHTGSIQFTLTAEQKEDMARQYLKSLETRKKAGM